MTLLDEIDEVEDVTTLTLRVPMWKTPNHPDGVDILFKGMAFSTLAEMQGTFDLTDVEQNRDLESMITLVAITAHDPETGEKLFDSERGKAILRGKGYNTVLFLLQNGATVVVGTDEAETAGKDSSSTPEVNPAFEGSSSESLVTPAGLSGSLSTAVQLTAP